MKIRLYLLLFLLGSFLNQEAYASDDQGTVFLRQPTVSAEHIVFVYAGDLWRVEASIADGIGEIKDVYVEIFCFVIIHGFTLFLRLNSLLC